MDVKTIRDLIPLFPSGMVTEKSSDELASPCPFCPTYEGTTIEFNNKTFVGTDRFIWFVNSNTFYCRRCHAENRKHVWNVAELVSFFRDVYPEIDIHASLIFEEHQPVVKKPVQFWRSLDLGIPHAQVQRPFFYQFGWTDETINYFKLGFSDFQGRLSHLMPLPVITLNRQTGDWYFISARTVDGEKRHQVGDMHTFFGFIHDDPTTSTVVLTEGPKDFITAYQLGFKNVACAFGAMNWSEEKTKTLAQKFETLFIFGDNDDAGKNFNRIVAAQAHRSGMFVKILEYDNTKPQNFDLTNLNEILRSDSYEYILDHLFVPTFDSKTDTATLRSSFISDYESIDPTYQKPEIKSVSLDEIRGNSVQSLIHRIDRFLEDYQSKITRTKGSLLLLRAGPGSGKTHTLIRVAERIAKKALEKHYEKIAVIEEEIDNLKIELNEIKEYEDRLAYTDLMQKLIDKLENYSFTSVLWICQYKDSIAEFLATGANANVWMEFKARDEQNCKNFEVVKELGTKNHNVGQYCELVCPFRAQCRKSGYLSQEQERRKKPITILRHQSLNVLPDMSQYRDLVVIDESPLHVAENPIIFKAGQIYPHKDTWKIELDNSTIIEAIDIFITSLRHSMNFNIGKSQSDPDYTISGATFYRQLDSQIKVHSENRYTLSTLCETIPSRVLYDSYQPTYMGDTDIKLRCIPFLFDALLKELPAYINNPTHTLPSRIHLVSGDIELYPMERVKISPSTPIVVADATGMMEKLYEGMFNRNIEIYQPTIYNPNAEVIVFRGSDWTLSHIENNVGKQLRDRNARTRKEVHDVLGDVFNLDDIPTNPDLYNDPLILDYKDSITSILERHGQLLVITHKRIRFVIEDLFRQAYPETYKRLFFGHYNAMRGTNRFKDVEAVLLIGQPRMPYDIMYRRIQSWAAMLELGREVPKEMGYYPAPYHMQSAGHTYYTFSDPFARDYADNYEVGEMIQCAERIRPHSTQDKKYIYVMASRPSVHFVNRIITKNELLSYYRSSSKFNRIKDYMIQVYESTGTLPKKRETIAMFACGSELYTKVRKDVETNLHNRGQEKLY